MVNGTLIRQAREAKGLSRGKLAERLGIAEHTIYRWEHGIHSRLSFDTVSALASALGVSTKSITSNGNDSSKPAPEMQEGYQDGDPGEG